LALSRFAELDDYIVYAVYSHSIEHIGFFTDSKINSYML
jgi:hypothetical protein